MFQYQSLRRMMMYTSYQNIRCYNINQCREWWLYCLVRTSDAPISITGISAENDYISCQNISCSYISDPRWEWLYILSEQHVLRISIVMTCMKSNNCSLDVMSVLTIWYETVTDCLYGNNYFGLTVKAICSLDITEACVSVWNQNISSKYSEVNNSGCFY